MIKKLLIVLLLFFSFILFGCEDISNSSNEITLPDLSGMNREEIAKVLADKNIKYVFKFADVIINDNSELDTFVSYNGKYKAGDKISSNYQIYVYTTVLPLTYKISDQVKLDLDYQGKSFVDDGIGKVTLIRSIDGDTAWFRDLNGEQIKLRFLGINTPESTIDKQAWGKAASTYTANRLKNASTIVLEREGAIMDTYERYLGFVWVDGVLLNLELVEQAFTPSTLSDSKYETYFSNAAFEARKTGRRYYGEIDPQYDYENGTFK